MDGKDISIYIYNRGPDYSCKVVIQNDHTTFRDMKYPVGTDPEIIHRLVDEAEREAMKLHAKKENKRWSNTLATP